jgi:phenylpropionate dioxygenase-like ring-hydroxylating dioxygenase large terminal subunit
VPKPGDYMTHDHTGVPILLVRRQDGSLGDLNVIPASRRPCGRMRLSKLFVCPYHAWSYDTEANCVAVDARLRGSRRRASACARCRWSKGTA